MRILVTGATGLLGNNVVRDLLASRQYEVRVLVRNPADPALDGLDLEFSAGDIRDASAVALAGKDCQAVIHCAAAVQLGWSKLDEHRAINVAGTRHVVDACREAGARLVHVSTVNTLAVGQREQPADEETPRTGQIPCTYCVTKREAEALVDAAALGGLDAVVVHPGLMFGPWDWKPSSGRMLTTIANQWTPFAPVGGGSVCDVRDVAAAVVRTLSSDIERGRHFILAGQNIPYFDLWKRIAAVTGAKGPFMRAGPLMRIIGGRWGDMQTRLTGREPDVNTAGVAMSSQWHYYSSARAERELGYHIRPLEETLHDAWAWLRPRLT